MAGRENWEDQVIRRLDIIAGLQAANLAIRSEYAPVKKIIGILYNLGASNAEIASITGKKGNYVGATLSKIKKSSRGKKHGK
jgi:hypothetical protein